MANKNNSLEDYKKRFNTWRGNEYFDADTQNELSQISADKDEIYDRFYKNLEFGTAGLRGVMGAGTNRMNVYVVRRASFAVAEYILSLGKEAAASGIAVAYDTRNNSFTYAAEAASVFASRGIKTYIFDATAPVPLLSFTVWSMQLTAGIMITASHNPKEYNGYKVFWKGGVQISPEIAGEITAIIDRYDDISSLPPLENYRSLKKRRKIPYVPAEVVNAYLDRVAGVVADEDIIKKHGDSLVTVYSPLHGAGARYVKSVFKRRGLSANFHIVGKQEKADGDFPTVVLPNPETDEAFTLGLRMARKFCADIVIGTDPDSDRAGAFVRDKDGNYKKLTGNKIGCLFMEYLVECRRRNNKLPKAPFAVSTIVSTDLAPQIAQSKGVEFKQVLTGFKYIGDLITDENKDSFILGFEESYGFLTEGYARDKDGVAASLILAEMALYYKVAENKTLCEKLDELYQRFGYRHESAFSIELTGESGHESILKIMDTLREKGASILPYKIRSVMDVKKSTITDCATGKVGRIDLPESDVLKYETDKGWIAVRPSGTEPKIKIYVGIRSGISEEDADGTAAKIKEELKDIISGLI
ncbi:MAG: phospho-sugar mutase [Clostridia bacterium]|nr:phospho-sugar mutase [Clostridia bacterium]